MDSVDAIWNGGLANNKSFFGGALAEVTARNDGNGAWHDGLAHSVSEAYSISRRGGQSANSATAGVFTYHWEAGNTNNPTSHRTILLGY
ncbi:hypothetical protein FWG76_02845 [Candidatus Saccharibacteria bacterium]|nr:hypothetical protein [Candidatus Saccharibacteria bacterium]